MFQKVKNCTSAILTPVQSSHILSLKVLPNKEVHEDVVEQAEEPGCIDSVRQRFIDKVGDLFSDYVKHALFNEGKQVKVKVFKYIM